MADKNFAITNKRGIEVSVPEWLYNINNINGGCGQAPHLSTTHD